MRLVWYSRWPRECVVNRAFCSGGAASGDSAQTQRCHDDATWRHSYVTQRHSSPLQRCKHGNWISTRRRYATVHVIPAGRKVNISLVNTTRWRNLTTTRMHFTLVNSILANKHVYVSLELEFRISCINRSLYRNTCILLNTTSKIRFIMLGNVFTLNYFTSMDLKPGLLITYPRFFQLLSQVTMVWLHSLSAPLTHSLITYLMRCGVAS